MVAEIWALVISPFVDQWVALKHLALTLYLMYCIYILFYIMYNIHIVKRFRAHCGFYTIENKLLLLLLYTVYRYF